MEAGIPVSRDCLLCGAMICGCAEHRDPIHSMQAEYGICDSCVCDVAPLIGEKVEQDADDAVRLITAAPQKTLRRMKAYLDSLQKERAS